MVKYEDALAIAKSVKTHPITKCTEYTDAYVFAETFPEGVIARRRESLPGCSSEGNRPANPHAGLCYRLWRNFGREVCKRD